MTQVTHEFIQNFASSIINSDYRTLMFNGLNEHLRPLRSEITEILALANIEAIKISEDCDLYISPLFEIEEEELSNIIEIYKSMIADGKIHLDR